MIKCIISDKEVKQYFTFKDTNYGFCCKGCIGGLISKIVNKDPKVDSIVLESTKDLIEVKLNQEQKERLSSIKADKSRSISKRNVKKSNSMKKRNVKKSKSMKKRNGKKSKSMKK